MNIFHLNCLKINTSINPDVIGHCLLIENYGRLILVDTGLGVMDNLYAQMRLGEDLIRNAGFVLDDSLTAWNQIKKLGYDPAKVSDIIVSHLDPDHIGGLVDFPNAKVHVSEEEIANFYSGNSRYLFHQLQHTDKLIKYPPSSNNWFGLESRKIKLQYSTININLIPLFGHTYGHCGVAIQSGINWIFYVGDAYYMREELNDEKHPVHKFAAMRADDNETRLKTTQLLKQLINTYDNITMYSYHDRTEFISSN